MFNSSQVAGVIRIILSFAVGWLSSHGYISNTLAANLIGLGVVVGVAVWSYYSNTLASLLDHVASSPDVHQVVVNDPDLATNAPSPKVVSLPQGDHQ
jgi:hypothetical protein